MTGATIIRRFARSRKGIAAVEFALILPLFLGLLGAGVEVSWLLLTNMKVQRLATMTADLIARDGTSTRRISELQIYDTLSAMDLAAQPLDMRGRGRLVISSVLGEDTNADGLPDINRIMWQRFDGGLISAPKLIGCITANNRTTAIPRQLRLGEPLFHVQVSYAYQPIFSGFLVRWLSVPTMITRTATYRGRGAIHQPVLTVENYPAKTNCNTANGL